MTASDPMTPPDCDLRGMPYMPVDLVRLFDSDIYALSSGDEFKAAFTLWGKAFLQVPAGSLPTDDRILAHLSGAGARWPKVKAMALRGWVECSDGRLYHTVVSEKARDAWESRLAQRARTEAARAARAAKRQDCDTSRTPPVAMPVTTSVTETGEKAPEVVTGAGFGDAAAQHGNRLSGRIETTTVYNPSYSVDSYSGGASVTETVTGSKGELRESKGNKEEDISLRSISPARRKRALSDPAFPDFWAAYPRKVGRGAAERAFAAAVAKGATVAEIAAGLNRQTWPADAKFIPHPATWLNQARWMDDPAAAAPPQAAQQPAGKLDWLWQDMRAEAEEFPDFSRQPGGLLQ